MGRYIGPKCKKCRRIGESVCGTAKCALLRRNTPPGIHGAQRTRVSEYGLQLREKQKAKAIFGIMEKQFRNYYLKASARTGNTAELFLRLLEQRLDNVVYRAGFASTRRQARQLVSHGHFKVNGKRCDIPSRQVEGGDVIELRDKSKKGAYIQSQLDAMKNHHSPKWLLVDNKATTVTVQSTPDMMDMEQGIAINLIVEYYSR